METDRTGFFDYDNMTNEQRRSIILEKIEGDIKEVKELLEKPSSDKAVFKLRGKQDAFGATQSKNQLYTREFNTSCSSYQSYTWHPTIFKN